MTNSERILQHLEKSGEPMTAYEIASALTIHYNAVGRTLRALRVAGQIQLVRRSKEYPHYRWRAVWEADCEEV